MGKPYSMDLRTRVVASVEREGLSRRQAAERYGVGISTVTTTPLWHSDAVRGVHPINLGSHKGKAVRRAIRSAGARLFLLPKYSPTSTLLRNSSPSSSIGCARLPGERRDRL
ncbi:MAG: hypothetical protein E5V16_10960 [Mesorhizobium sp.]|nr:MAG: hypothetical protein E5V16_10960 [Mesorhizobium sp.]